MGVCSLYYIVMKLFFLSILWPLLTGFSLQENKISWSPTQKLTWEDFRGVPNALDLYVASTNSGISFSFFYKEHNGVELVSTTVVSNFYPDLSWYRPHNVSKYILAHEQTHFNITELHARKLREQLSTLSYNNTYKIKATELYNKIEAERRLMQRTYDKETNHSNNKEEEYKWQQFVEQNLLKYKDWE